MQRPDRTEAAEYYFKYIDQVADGDIRDVLEGQLPETLSVLSSITEEISLHRFAPEKWSIREVLSHVNDTERVFAFRTLWFARGLQGPLAGFDQNVTVPAAGADSRSWSSHVEEFRVVRAASSALFRSLPTDAWTRGGVASGHICTVRALAYITAGHVAHHMKLVRERYL